MIKIQAIGNLGNNAVVNSFDKNKAINFSIAVNERFKNEKGEYDTRTTWLSCTYWRFEGQSAEISEYLKSGTKVYVEGIPHLNTYTNQNGEKVSQMAIRVQAVELLSSQKTPEKQNALPDADAEAAIQNEIAGNPDDDDLPF